MNIKFLGGSGEVGSLAIKIEEVLKMEEENEQVL